jgi:hypothetical protein
VGFPNATRQIAEEIAALLPASAQIEEEALLAEGIGV